MSASTPSTANAQLCTGLTQRSQGAFHHKDFFFLEGLRAPTKCDKSNENFIPVRKSCILCDLAFFYSKNTHFIFYLQDVELSSMYLKFQQKFFLGLNNYKCSLLSAYLSIVCNGFFMLLFCFLFIGELMLEYHVVSCLKKQNKEQCWRL